MVPDGFTRVNSKVRGRFQAERTLVVKCFTPGGWEAGHRAASWPRGSRPLAGKLLAFRAAGYNRIQGRIVVDARDLRDSPFQASSGGECMATCPECDAEVEVDDDDLEEMEIGDPWDCDACGSRLRVANLDPLDFESDEEDDEEEEDEEEAGETADTDEGDVDDDLDDTEDDSEDWDE
jgi:hypothetical protein